MFNFFKRNKREEASTRTMRTFKIYGVSAAGFRVTVNVRAYDADDARKRVLSESSYKDAKAYYSDDNRDYSTRIIGIQHVSPVYN